MANRGPTGNPPGKGESTEVRASGQPDLTEYDPIRNTKGHRWQNVPGQIPAQRRTHIGRPTNPTSQAQAKGSSKEVRTGDTSKDGSNPNPSLPRRDYDNEDYTA